MSRDDKKNVFNVDVSPEMQMYVILQHLNYNLETAYAEFIDNSVQSFLEHEERLKLEEPDSTPSVTISIDISSKDNLITIRDNAFGIKREDMQRALKLGVELNTIHSPDSLSVYGIGMKSSAIWFTNSWAIKSSAFGENEALNFTFDLYDLLSKHSTKATVTAEAADPSEHYTKIILKNHIRPETREHYANHVVPFIAETFHKFRGKVVIEFRYDGELIEPNKKKTVVSTPPTMIYPPIDKDSKIREESLIEWRVDLDFTYQNKPVTGFIMIRKKGGYNHPGIRLIRNHRVIKGVSVNNNIVADIVGTANKFVAEKLYGELNLDAFPVDFMKTNFNQNLKGLYQELKRILQDDYAFNILFQAEFYRKKVADSVENKKIVAILNEKGDIQPLLKKDEYKPLAEGVKEKSENLVSEKTSADEVESDQGVNGEGDEGAIPNELKETTVEPPNEEPPSSTNQGYGIKRSEALEKAIKKLSNKKLEKLYDSLCALSLYKHSVLLYVGAWGFIETLTAHMQRKSQTPFPDFLAQKVNHFYQKDRETKQDVKRVIADISQRGNCTKHSKNYYNDSATDLIVYFEILEPFLIQLIESYISEDKG